MNNTAYTPSALAQMDDVQLYSNMEPLQWMKLTPDAQLAVCQEIENRMARMQHRNPVPVRLIKPEDGESAQTCFGFWSPSEQCIAINPRFITQSPTARLTQFNSCKLLNTMIHEGRHAQQYNICKNGNAPDGMPVPQDMILQWIVNKVAYTDIPPYYSIQANELDARLYASDKAKAIFAQLEKAGIVSPSFVIERNRAIECEKRYVNQTIKLITREALAQREAIVRNKAADFKIILPADYHPYPAVNIILDMHEKKYSVDGICTMLKAMHDYGVGLMSLENLCTYIKPDLVKMALTYMNDKNALARLAKIDKPVAPPASKIKL